MCDSSAGSGGSRKSGLALSVARGWRKLVGEATSEVRWLPTGCLQLLDTLQQVGACGSVARAGQDRARAQLCYQAACSQLLAWVAAEHAPPRHA